MFDAPNLEVVLKKLFLVALVLGVISFVAPVLVQAQPMTVSGIATSADGSVLANTEMRLVASDGSVHTATTNAMGEWTIANVPSGGFTVSIVVNGDPLDGGLVVPAGGAATGLTVAAPGTGLSAGVMAAIAVAIAAGVGGGIAAARNDAS